jgi:aldehyde dehydrogenase (NAD+)
MTSVENALNALGVRKKNESASTGRNWYTAVGSVEQEVTSPVDGSVIGTFVYATETEYEAVINKAQKAYETWKEIPAPKRGDIVRQIGEKLRLSKEHLGTLVSYEMGKSLQEGLGEVQEMIDICDFAVGLSRQLYGLSMHSERPNHRMYEQWHPLGIVGIISAFNFPVAVWSWNSMIAAVCGNVSVWKPSEKAPLSAVACQHIVQNVLIENELPEGIFNIVQGDRKIGQMMAADSRVALVSATGSTAMGKAVGKTVAERMGKSLLELGGNNAIIVSENANLSLAVKASVFGATGTCGQRCTSTRRLIVHSSLYDQFKDQIVSVYKQLKIGTPMDEANHVGPLIDIQAVEQYQDALEKVVADGGKIVYGGNVLSGPGYESGCYVEPTIVEANNWQEMVQKETFAPIVYIMKYNTLDEAIAMQNDVKQGLSSSLFTENIMEAEQFLSDKGSDCGIANVNIGTSGAEIGGAFGGEKETGGGRESGSDAWKAYMRRQTNTINYSGELPLAQGIKFDI